jgi:phosphate transport system protein
VSIARRATFLSKRDPVELPPEIARMGELARLMVKKSLDALINSDARLAREVCAADDEVDDLKRRVMKIIRQRIETDPANFRAWLKILDIPRHLERMADLATNISEDVIYLVDGEIVRHKRVLARAEAARDFDE